MKLELVRTKKTNRVAIHSTDTEAMEPLLDIVETWCKEYCEEHGIELKVIRRDSINVRKNDRRTG